MNAMQTAFKKAGIRAYRPQWEGMTASQWKHLMSESHWEAINEADAANWPFYHVGPDNVVYQMFKESYQSFGTIFP